MSQNLFSILSVAMQMTTCVIHTQNLILIDICFDSHEALTSLDWCLSHILDSSQTVFYANLVMCSSLVYVLMSNYCYYYYLFVQDLSYNIALCHYMMKQYAPALKHIADIIEKGIREHPGT